MLQSSFISVVKSIVEQQKVIIGPLAVEEANKVNGLHVSSDLSQINIQGDGKNVLQNLALEYEKMFGQASIEVCKDAVKEMKPPISSNELPEILR